jgi:hypothetical protein
MKIYNLFSTVKTKLAIFVAAFSLMLASCTTDDETTGETSAPISEISGQWTVSETIKNSGTSAYKVTVSAGESAGEIYIYNFFNLGSKIVAYASVSDKSINIPSQTLTGGDVVKGTGVIGSSNDYISLSYTVDDNSGEPFEVTNDFNR